jgi:polyisoprenoid-binding protein YceI
MSGTFQKNGDRWVVAVEIHTRSIDTGSRERDATILEKQYLHAKEYPDIHFTGNAEGSEDELQIFGRLTLRGVSRDISFVGRRSNNMINIESILLSRKNFNLDFGEMDALIGDEITVSIKAVMR